MNNDDDDDNDDLTAIRLCLLSQSDQINNYPFGRRKDANVK